MKPVPVVPNPGTKNAKAQGVKADYISASDGVILSGSLGVFNSPSTTFTKANIGQQFEILLDSNAVFLTTISGLGVDAHHVTLTANASGPATTKAWAAYHADEAVINASLDPTQIYEINPSAIMALQNQISVGSGQALKIKGTIVQGYNAGNAGVHSISTADHTGATQYSDIDIDGAGGLLTFSPVRVADPGTHVNSGISLFFVNRYSIRNVKVVGYGGGFMNRRQSCSYGRSIGNTLITTAPNTLSQQGNDSDHTLGNSQNNLYGDLLTCSGDDAHSFTLETALDFNALMEGFVSSRNVLNHFNHSSIKIWSNSGVFNQGGLTNAPDHALRRARQLLWRE